LAVGSFVGAGVGFYIVLIRSLLMERQTTGVTSVAIDHSEYPKTAFEASDWELAPVAAVYIGTLVLLVISCLVLIPAYPGALPDTDRTLHITPPGPRLQTNPEADLHRLLADEHERLTGYHWIDRQKGIVRIPIEQAMRKLARTGIDGFPKAQQ
jgi:hypothetical protein